jgi:hypothetical protein
LKLSDLLCIGLRGTDWSLGFGFNRNFSLGFNRRGFFGGRFNL